MTDEVEVVEAVEAGDQAAFEAGYSGTPVEVAEPTPPAAEEVAPVEEPAQEAEPERNQWGYTNEEMKILLGKAARVDEIERGIEAERQRIYGKLGEYNRTIQSMQAANRGGALTVRQLNHLRGEFPDLADLLEKDFGEMQSAPQAALEPVPQVPAYDPEVIKKEVEAAKESMRQDLARLQLEDKHPDYQEVVRTEQFRTWVGLQPQEYQQKLRNSWEPRFVSDGLSSFKAWLAKTTNTSAKKTARLEAAVQPTGVGNSGPPALDDADAFLAGWKTVRG